MDDSTARVTVFRSAVHDHCMERLIVLEMATQLLGYSNAELAKASRAGEHKASKHSTESLHIPSIFNRKPRAVKKLKPIER